MKTTRAVTLVFMIGLCSHIASAAVTEITVPAVVLKYDIDFLKREMGKRYPFARVQDVQIGSSYTYDFPPAPYTSADDHLRVKLNVCKVVTWTSTGVSDYVSGMLTGPGATKDQAIRNALQDSRSGLDAMAALRKANAPTTGWDAHHQMAGKALRYFALEKAGLSDTKTAAWDELSGIELPVIITILPTGMPLMVGDMPEKMMSQRIPGYVSVEPPPFRKGDDRGNFPAQRRRVVVLNMSAHNADLGGHTLKHELGHWLGLPHPFGPGTCKVGSKDIAGRKIGTSTDDADMRLSAIDDTVYQSKSEDDAQGCLEKYAAQGLSVLPPKSNLMAYSVADKYDLSQSQRAVMLTTFRAMQRNVTPKTKAWISQNCPP